MCTSNLVDMMNSRRRCCMNEGSNHAAVFFTNVHKGSELWGKPP